MTLACWGFGGLVSLSWAYWALTLVAAWRFRRQVAQRSGPATPVTVLKPLCGLDHGLRENLASFLDQDYREFQVIFVAEDPEDPALDVARDVIAERPASDAMVLSGSSAAGANRKVANLVHAMAWAKHPLIVISDSDMRVQPQYLRMVTAPFADPAVGVATCLYRATEARSLAARLEALHIGADFIPSVLVAWLLMGPKFGFGSTLAIRREGLDRIGGFDSLLDELADDYRVVEKVCQSGYRSALASGIVECPLGPVPFSDTWRRRLRWSRTVRYLRPWGHLGALVAHGVPMACLLAGICADPAVRWLAVATLLIRLAVAPAVAGVGARDGEALRNLPLLLPSDCAAFIVWLCSWFGSSVSWRGRTVPLRSEETGRKK